MKLLGVAFSGIASPLARAGGAAPTVLADVRAGLPRWRPLAQGSLPRSFSRGELAALEELVELILPATDTPGAKAAGVQWYLDDVAAVEPRTRDQIKAGLARLEERMQATTGTTFAAATEAERTRMLSVLAEERDAFFAFVKDRVIDAYYKSEAGQLGELEWVGHEFYDAFPGACTHPDPAHHPRPRFTPRPANASRGGAR